MKERYVKPDTEVVEVQCESLLLAASPIPDDPLDIMAMNDDQISLGRNKRKRGVVLNAAPFLCMIQVFRV